ncbi:hypothetical protein CVT24_001077 [Panaeolus cyanescens]|uniref:Condensin complex subunit 1 n=1 Tax=Panaeolus cyanescens TaxID=181874 RepID=A0A409VX08_9AGAR|nr:hypothetical protein CVT24_001077 [Panaeolus cyanescens]
MSFIESFELQDELQNLQDVESYEIPNEDKFANEEPDELLEAAVVAVAESSDVIRAQDVFDAYRFMLKHSEKVPGSVMSKLLDSISSGCLAELESTMRDLDSGDQQAYMSHKTPLEMYAFLLNWFVTAVEKVKASDDDAPPPPTGKAKRGRGGKAGATRGGRSAAGKKNDSWTWQDQIVPTLALICKVLRLPSSRIWTTSAERDTFINCITRPAYHVMESETYMKVEEIKLSIYKAVCLAVKHHGQSMAVQITIMQNLQFYEHLSEHMAECLIVLSQEFDFPQLGDEVLREIASKTFNAQDAKGPRAFAKFIVKYAESCPRLVFKQLSLLLDQLDSESYPMRQAIVETIGFLIVELARNSEAQDTDPKKTQKQINGLFNLLLERMLDNSSYVRVKVLAVFTKVTRIETFKFPKHRLAITTAAVSALDDKTPSVRKAAAALLTQLLLTHPYGATYGGVLTREMWEKDYAEIVAKLDKIESAVGNVVQAQNAEAEEEEEGDKKKKKKRRKSKAGQDDSMEVDGEENEEGEDDDEGAEEDEEEDGDTEPEDDGEMSVDEEDEAQDGEASPKRKKKKASKLKPRKSQLDINALTQEQAVLAQYDENQIKLLQLQKKFYGDALTFIKEIESAMDPMVKLLGSTNKAEVLEVMEFFKTVHEYQINGAEDGVRKMLHLIWTKDNSTSTSEDGKELKGVRQRLLECYRALYFDPVADLEAKAQINRIAKNLIERTYERTLAELTSLEEMMRIMMEEGHIHHDVITKLWAVYGKDRNLPRSQRRGAILILGMLAVAKRSILQDKVELMLKVGLGALGKSDPTLARYTCVALQRLGGSAKKIKGSLIDKTDRIDMDNVIFRKLEAAILHPSRTKEWFGMAEQAINTVYALGDHPDVFCDELIKKLTLRVFSKKTPSPSENPEEDAGDAMNEDQPGDTTFTEADVTMQDATQATQGDSTDFGDAFELSQLLFVVGHVAIKQIVFLELIEREWKRQKDEKEAADKKASGNQKKEVEELDQVAGNAEDEIGDRIAGVRETELLYGPESLLAMFGDMLVYIVGSPKKFRNPTLRAAAVLSFSKFLCVSSQFCDKNYRLLFKILETSKDPNIRSNVVIALGDVAVSFSSIIDENSSELYKGLSDTEMMVKKNTLMVLTHLILNGMIKVKGQLGEMAKCVEDPDPRIADLAKLFFKELSTKENAIYNNLPDVISHLSTGDHAVDEEMFESTLRYIFTFIEKEKQAESIVDKLCQRFRLTEDPRQWRDIAFCLSLLPFKSERSMKKLIEGFQNYRDKLHEPKVYARFVEILAKARNNKSKDKPDSDLNEFERMLEEYKQQGEEDHALEKRAEGKKAAAKKRAQRKSKSKPFLHIDTRLIEL